MTIKNASHNDLHNEESDRLRPKKVVRREHRNERYVKNAIRSNNPNLLAQLNDDDMDEDEFQDEPTFDPQFKVKL